MEQREIFKEEHGFDCYAYRQDYDIFPRKPTHFSRWMN